MANELLINGLRKAGVEDYQRASERLSLYISELMMFNPALKLVGDKDEKGIIIRHILDSAACYVHFRDRTKSGDTIADLGSGSGLPGIVLAILLEDRQFVLIERMTRRVGFLRGVVAKLKLKNVIVDDRDIKDVDRTFSVLTCRAFHPLSDIAEDTVKLLSAGGLAMLYKGQRKSILSEIEGLERKGYAFMADIIELDVPYLNEERNLCILSDWRNRREL